MLARAARAHLTIVELIEAIGEQLAIKVKD